MKNTRDKQFDRPSEESEVGKTIQNTLVRSQTTRYNHGSLFKRVKYIFESEFIE